MRFTKHAAWMLAAALAGCGGGDDGSAPETMAIVSTASLDGTLGFNGPPGDPGASAAGLPCAGDADTIQPGWVVHGMFSFDITQLLAGIPAGKTVQSVTFLAKQGNVHGTPYTDHGKVVMDHVGYGDVLGSNDPSVVYQSAFGVLSTTPVKEVKSLDVTVQVLADLAAGRDRSQFRIRFDLLGSDVDPYSDLAIFSDAEGHQAFLPSPTLLVTFAE